MPTHLLLLGRLDVQLATFHSGKPSLQQRLACARGAVVLATAEHSRALEVLQRRSTAHGGYTQGYTRDSVTRSDTFRFYEMMLTEQLLPFRLCLHRCSGWHASGRCAVVLATAHRQDGCSGGELPTADIHNALHTVLPLF